MPSKRRARSSSGHYVVEAILADATVDGVRMYEIKWEGFSDEHNSWVAEQSLQCPDLLAAYHAARRPNCADLSPFYRILRDARDYHPIVVTNTVDDCGGPDDFTYINESTFAEDVPRPCTPLHACSCTNGCSTGCSCMRQRCYDEHGRVCVPEKTALLECGPRCACDAQCQTRVVQHGSRVKFEIRRFPLKGWGVVARAPIPRGTFVAEYVGELITFEEAEQRGAADSARGLTYLFDLDMGCAGDLADFTIDAKRYGNIAHFFNHSCAPNMQLYPAYVEHRDPRLHRLAFFAARDIAAGEELTFDYSPSCPDSSGAMFACACGAAECRKQIFM
ncbi:hypothetical protein LPJ78_000531 [Coemansia sp. RSA 989]|nr:hypothetical protein BX667DRAFT_501803 [Coemansia mojavensis]KAJ1740364.1 hypothetical protein LPJ68_003847 [Coemansia sp. RSA 1086]KAJ1753050.1 hypothetical protein LPJ79_000690 [Coemansia sp. RSA 1821]KAJ1868034.1 hypothetical protein LPJ78_000531 [Coemansia sp. RSA 989]KAJ1875387.1 hypothetical protein LPJ55_000743 [Coemansia sp. RSA 990]KAJ2674256.1 hypothetical protein IWW42_001756 [Coemansia sp. RSA 1085]